MDVDDTDSERSKFPLLVFLNQIIDGRFYIIIIK